MATDVRIITASGLAWVAAIILPIGDFWPANVQFAPNFIVLPVVIPFTFLAFDVYFNVSIFKEIRRSEKQIITNQVSLEVKEKLLKNKKSFYCTTTKLLAIFLCYIPGIICFIIVISFKESIPIHVKLIMFNLSTLFPILNSLFNPLIYAVRIRYFRVAFIELFSRKTFAQAEQLERNIFGPKEVRTVSTAEQGANRVSRREDEVVEGNETLTNGNLDGSTVERET